MNALEILYLLCCIVIPLGLYVAIRAHKVLQFRILINRANGGYLRNEYPDRPLYYCHWEIYDSMACFERMVCSIKPLKPEYWLSPENQKLIKPFYDKIIEEKKQAKRIKKLNKIWR
jgi:hypothetical protein